MKRSEINNAIDLAMKRLDEYKIKLPMFAYWTPDEVGANDDKMERIKKRMLGWDVTDFGSGDFKNAELFCLQ